MPPTQESVERGDHFIRLRGREVYRFAVTKMADLIKEAAGDHPQDQIGLIVPHQVNQRIIEAAMDQVGLPMSLVHTNIDRLGNTSAASVPIALSEAVAAGKVKKGQLVVMVAFGAGMAWGHTVLRW